MQTHMFNKKNSSYDESKATFIVQLKWVDGASQLWELDTSWQI